MSFCCKIIWEYSLPLSSSFPEASSSSIPLADAPLSRCSGDASVGDITIGNVCKTSSPFPSRDKGGGTDRGFGRGEMTGEGLLPSSWRAIGESNGGGDRTSRLG